MFFSIFALILTKVLPKRVFLYFYPFTKDQTKIVFFPTFALNLQALPKRCFLFFRSHPNLSLKTKCVFSLFFCPFSNQSPTKNGVFFSSIFALVLIKALPKSVFFLYFYPNLTKAPPQRVLYSIFALILNNALPKSVFFLIYNLF